jgi:hypothetical protein
MMPPGVLLQYGNSDCGVTNRDGQLIAFETTAIDLAKGDFVTKAADQPAPSWNPTWICDGVTPRVELENRGSLIKFPCYQPSCMIPSLFDCCMDVVRLWDRELEIQCDRRPKQASEQSTVRRKPY